MRDLVTTAQPGPCAACGETEDRCLGLILAGGEDDALHGCCADCDQAPAAPQPSFEKALEHPTYQAGFDHELLPHLLVERCRCAAVHVGPCTSGRAQARQVRRGNDHPSNAQHIECLTNHGGRGVPRHCQCGFRWPCPLTPPAARVVTAPQTDRQPHPDVMGSSAPEDS